MQRPPTNRSIKINEQIHNEILPRSQKLKKLQNMNEIPKTTEDQVIVPCLQKTFGFKTNQYTKNYKYLNGVISLKQFNQFVRKANQIIEEEIIKKNKMENQPFFSVISVLLKICIVIAIFTFVLMACIVYVDLQKSSSQNIMIITTVLLACISVIAGICPIILYNSKYAAHNYEQFMKQRLDDLAIKQNKKNFSNNNRHILWKFEKNFFWIQLNINRMLFETQGKRLSDSYVINFSGVQGGQRLQVNQSQARQSNSPNQECQSVELSNIDQESQTQLKRQGRIPQM